eukprot:2894910-Rhodomonas_salina.2
MSILAGFRVWCSGLESRGQASGWKLQASGPNHDGGLGVREQDSGFRDKGSGQHEGFRAEELGFGVEGHSGFTVLG